MTFHDGFLGASRENLPLSITYPPPKTRVESSLFGEQIARFGLHPLQLRYLTCIASVEHHLDPFTDHFLVARLFFDQNHLALLAPASLACGAGASKRIKTPATFRCHHANQPLHQVDRLNRWMVETHSIIGVCLAIVSEARRVFCLWCPLSGFFCRREVVDGMEYRPKQFSQVWCSQDGFGVFPACHIKRNALV